MTTDNEYDSSRAGETSSSPAPDSGYAEHQNNGQSENGYHMDGNDSQNINSSQTGYSQGSGSGTGTSTGSKPEDERKLFVGQLSSDITKEDLQKYFSKFGTIEDVTIKYDVPGGRARGFAFILFDDKESIQKVLNVQLHTINQCQIDPKPAHRRPR